MQEIVNQIIMFLKELVTNSPYFVGILMGMFVIILESMIPMLPLAVFIALNIILFGNIVGFVMSWIATCLGCILMFFLVRKYFRNYFVKKTKNIKQVKKLMKNFEKINFSSLVIITALPFTPAFLINIAAGLSDMSVKEFISNILISKLVVIYFWGYIGTSFLQSVTDVTVLIKLGLILIIAYAISKIVMKKEHID